jgi:hypothetical protein
MSKARSLLAGGLLLLLTACEQPDFTPPCETLAQNMREEVIDFLVNKVEIYIGNSLRTFAVPPYFEGCLLIIDSSSTDFKYNLALLRSYHLRSSGVDRILVLHFPE